MPRRSPRIAVARPEDLAEIRAWLELQEKIGVEATFLCNWAQIERAQAEGELLVYLDPATGSRLGFQLGGLLTPGILEIRQDRRGQGLGREFAEHCMALAFEAGEDILFIQCEPHTSIPFWRSMGFTIVDHEGKTYGFQILHRNLQTAAGEPVQVEIEWYAEEKNWNNAAAPLQRQVLTGIRTPEDGVQLPVRVHYFDRFATGRTQGDTVVRIVVDGVEWYNGKAKYDDADDVGVSRCRNGFAVDVLYRPT